MSPSALRGLPRRAWLLLGRSPLDLSTPEGRSGERYRRVALTALASGAAKAIGLLAMLVSVPLTVSYLGEERYGLWMTVSSTVALLGFADLGIGNGLMNAVSEANGLGDRAAALRSVSSAVFVLLAAAALLAAAFALAYPHIPWPRLFNVRTALAAREAGPAMAVFAACFAAGIPLGVVERVQLGYQEGFANGLWRCAGSLLGLLLLLLAIRAEAGLPWLVAALAGPPPLAALANAATLFGRRRPWLRPSARHVSRAEAGRLLRLGFLFFVLQLAMVAALSSDNIVAAQLLGPEAVTRYSVPGRLFGVVPLVLGMLLYPLWPAYAEAVARGDRAWARRTLGRSLLVCLGLAGPACLLLLACGRRLVSLWVAPELAPSPGLLAGFAAWTLLSSVGGAMGMFLNGTGVVRLQVICASLFAAVSLAAKVVLVPLLGLPGIVWGTAAAYALCASAPEAFYLWSYFNRQEVESHAAAE